jgi:Asp-tRNA(Asn)/Glu-tRNA(Gln) amidotransferase A subunit family amidase
MGNNKIHALGCDLLADHDAAALLESLGHNVDEMPNPVSPSFAEDFADYWGFLAFMSIRFGHHRFGKDFDPGQVDDLTRGLAARFRRRSWYLPRVLFRLQRTFRQHAEAMKDYDLVLSPVLAHVTAPLDTCRIRCLPDSPWRLSSDATGNLRVLAQGVRFHSVFRCWLVVVSSLSRHSDV